MYFMKLVGSLTSPYVRKARMAMLEKRIEAEFVVDVPWDANSAVSTLNPLGKVPVLILDDESTLFDSRVIVEYFDQLTPVNRLIPEDSKNRIRVKRWEALTDGITDAASAIFMENHRRDPEFRSQAWIDRQQQKINLGLAALSKEVGEDSWCTGESFNLADIVTSCVLGYLVFRFADIPWQSEYPNLAKIYEKLQARPSFIETAPPAA